MNITIDMISDYMNKFHEKYIEGKLPIRGRVFSGMRFEIYDKDCVNLVLTHPKIRGTTEEEKATDFVRGLHAGGDNISVELTQDKLAKLISGEIVLSENDWIWDDEFI